MKIQEEKMSLADEIFINMCKDVIENGTSTEGEKVRPVWEDEHRLTPSSVLAW